MSLKWTVSHRRRLIIAVAQGEVSALEMLSYVASVDQHKAQSYRKLFDVRGLATTFSTERIRAFGTIIRDRPGPAGPIAVVVGDNEQIRVQASIFVRATEAARLIKIFGEQNKAQTWLDRPQAQAAADI